MDEVAERRWTGPRRTWRRSRSRNALAGEMVFGPDLTNLPGIVLQPGDTLYFQLWFRDFTTGPTSNTTDGVEVMFR